MRMDEHYWIFDLDHILVNHSDQGLQNNDSITSKQDYFALERQSLPTNASTTLPSYFSNFLSRLKRMTAGYFEDERWLLRSPNDIIPSCAAPLHRRGTVP